MEEVRTEKIVGQLINVQSKLKAPKGQYNSFGKYNYRSCEDILESVKPLLAEEGLILTISDEIVQIGDRFYIRATASVRNELGEMVYNTAYAREPLDKKGMDESQITGTASSYARKYALNGLFLIDDTKDADTDEYAKRTGAKNKRGETAEESEQNQKMIQASKAAPITQAEIATLKSMCEKKGLDAAKTFPGGIANLTGEQYLQAVENLKGVKDKA